MTWRFWAGLVAVIVLGLVGVMFHLQNVDRAVELSLDLGFAAWRLSEPAPASVVVGVALGAGVLVGVLALLPAVFAARSRVTDLEDRLARASLGRSGSDEWSS